MRALSTVASLSTELSRLGVTPESTILVHASLSSIGFVCGGAVAVVEALLRSAGTVVMPAFSGDLSEPSRWKHPPVPEEWWPIIRSEMPAFDPRTTPTWAMGAIAEVFRTWPGTLRSAHPKLSFAAHGPHAETIVGTHPLEHAFGETSPLARLYALDAQVLLLGVGFDRNTSFHLAEDRAQCRREVTEGAPVLENGTRVWKTYTDIEYDASSFAEIGAALVATGQVRTGSIGAATAQLFSQRACVDFALRNTPDHVPGDSPRLPRESHRLDDESA